MTLGMVLALAGAGALLAGLGMAIGYVLGRSDGAHAMRMRLEERAEAMARKTMPRG